MIKLLVVIAIGAVGFLLLRDKAQTTAINTKGREQLGPPPQKVGVPDWVKQKPAQH